MSPAIPHPLHGLVAATHTPFHADGSLNLAAVEQQAAHLLKGGVATVFIGGSTGESASLSLDERRALAQRWSEVARGTALRVVVHAGSNCLADARSLAAQAQQLGAVAVSALAPSYYKPRALGDAELADVEKSLAARWGAPAGILYESGDTAGLVFARFLLEWVTGK